MTLSDALSFLAIAVSIGTFIWVEIKDWIKRPKLNIFLRLIRYQDKTDKKVSESMMTILLINDGYSPIIISQCKYFMESGGEGNLGIYDELKAPYGIHEIVLPVLLQPAEKFVLNFLRGEAIHKIKKIVLIDSYNKQHQVSDSELRAAKQEWERRSKDE